MNWLYSNKTFLFDTESGRLSEGEYSLYEGNEGKNVVVFEKGELVHRLKTEEELEMLKEVAIVGETYYHVFVDDNGSVVHKRTEEDEYASLKQFNARPRWQ